MTLCKNVRGGQMEKQLLISDILMPATVRQANKSKKIEADGPATCHLLGADLWSCVIAICLAVSTSL